MSVLFLTIIIIFGIVGSVAFLTEGKKSAASINSNAIDFDIIENNE